MRLALLVLLASALAAAEPPADKASFHIFLLMGQSNMAGSALPFLDAYREPMPRVLALAADRSWGGAAIHRSGLGGFGPGMAFARLYAEQHPEVTVGLIHCARGGRSLAELAKGGKDRDGAPNYDNAIAAAKAAQAKGVIKGVLWHQGESDAGDATYVKRLAGLVTDLRTDLGEPQLPFVCGELGRFAPWTAGFNGRIGAAASEIPRCAVASSADLRDLGDRVHFSGYAVEILGARYLRAWLSLAEPERVAAFEPVLATLTKAMLAREEAWGVIINGDMAEGGARPFAWDHQWVGKGKVEVARDTTTSVSAPASLRLRSLDGPAKASVEQPLRGVAGKTVTVTAQVRNAGFSSVLLRVTGLDGAYKQALNQPVIDATAATAWTRFEGSLAIPAEVPNCRLAFAVDGNGSAWLDDVVVTVAETPAAPAGSNLLRNGGMEDGEAQPTAWTSTWAGTGKVAAARDTAQFHGGKASLRVESVGGAAKGNASQAVEGLAGKRVRIIGWLRSDGKVAAAVGAGSFDASWKQLGWETIQVVPAGGASDWVAFDKTVTIPAGTAKVSLGATIDGEGKAWFDDLALCEVP